MIASDASSPGARFEALDGARGLAAILVMAFHIRAGSHLWDWPPIRHGNLAVDFFFTLSGFVIAHAYGARLGEAAQVGRFLLRRFGRLYPLHLATLAAMLLLILARSWFTKDGLVFTDAYSLPALGANLLLLNGVGLLDRFTWNQPIWSISTEFWAYVLFAGVWIGAGRHAILAAATIALAGGGWLTLNDLSPDPVEVVAGAGMVKCVFAFFTGVLTERLWRRLRPAAIWAWPALAAVMAVFWGWVPWSAAAGLIFAAFVLVMAQGRGMVASALTAPVVRWLGEISYSIYLVHGPVLFGVYLATGWAERHWRMAIWPMADGTTTQIGGPPWGPWALDALAIVYVGVVLILATLSFRYIEQPGRAWFNRRADSRRFEAGLGRV